MRTPHAPAPPPWLAPNPRPQALCPSNTVVDYAATFNNGIWDEFTGPRAICKPCPAGSEAGVGALKCVVCAPGMAKGAANLFAALRRLDAGGAAAIAVMAIPETGLGVAINDRLRRAAAPRG